MPKRKIDEKTIIFPLLRKIEGEISLNESPSEEDIQRLSFHLARETLLQLQNHNIHFSPVVFQDVEFLREVLEALIMRSVGKHTEVQDIIDKRITDFLERERLKKEEDPDDIA